MNSKLTKMPTNFADWKRTYEQAPQGSDSRTLALAKMVELATTLTQWEIIEKIAPEGSTSRAIAHDKAVEEYKRLEFD